jgi:hypothetical protein
MHSLPNPRRSPNPRVSVPDLGRRLGERLLRLPWTVQNDCAAWHDRSTEEADTCPDRAPRGSWPKSCGLYTSQAPKARALGREHWGHGRSLLPTPCLAKYDSVSSTLGAAPLDRAGGIEATHRPASVWPPDRFVRWGSIRWIRALSGSPATSSRSRWSSAGSRTGGRRAPSWRAGSSGRGIRTPRYHARCAEQ